MAKPSALKNKRILVSGANGFIGSHLSKSLYQIGAEVHGIFRTGHAVKDSNLTWLQGDVSDETFIRDVLSSVKPHIIFHLASHVSGSRGLDTVLPTFRSNLASTVNLLTHATAMGCERIILIGSMEEPDQQNLIPVPCSPYAAAKWASSTYARMFYALYKTPVVMARLFMVYGPGQQDLKKLIPYVTLSLLNNRPPELSSGNRPVDWIYVTDVVDGLMAAAEAPDIEGEIIDLGSGSLVTIKTVVDLLVKTAGTEINPLFGALNDRPFEQIRVANITDTRTKIGWEPSTSLEEGLSFTVDWYRKHYMTPHQGKTGE